MIAFAVTGRLKPVSTRFCQQKGGVIRKVSSNPVLLLKSNVKGAFICTFGAKAGAAARCQ